MNIALAQSVWITGASQGLGEALVLAYAKKGYRVYASARNEQALLQLAQRCEALPGECVAMPLDICELDSVKKLAEQLAQDAGLHTVILNAGTHIPQEAESFRAADVATLANLNLVGTANCIEAILPQLIRQQGQLAIVASLAGYRGLPRASGYGATKAGLINLAESLRIDLKDKGVDVRVVNPGFVKTPLTDKNDFAMPDLISAEQAAQAIVDGLQGKQFEIRFPKRFATVMAMLRELPYRLYFPAVSRITRR
jgi:short-subunit dehydrogenase